MKMDEASTQGVLQELILTEPVFSAEDGKGEKRPEDALADFPLLQGVFKALLAVLGLGNLKVPGVKPLKTVETLKEED